MTEVKYDRITDKGLIITSKEREIQSIKADIIVTVMPLAPNNELIKILEGKFPEIYSVGDCRKPRQIIDAISDGFRTASAL